MKIKSPDLQFAYGLAKRIGDGIFSKIDDIYSLNKKNKRDVSTDLEDKAEKEVVGNILKKYPTHSIFIEDGESINSDSPYAWYIDVLDGTKYFVKGIKMFTTAIGLWYKEEPFLGVVYNPSTKDCYFAEKGKGAFLNNKAIKVSELRDPKESIINIDNCFIEKVKGQELQEVESRTGKFLENFYRVRNLGIGSLSLCFLAQGGFDAHVDITGRQKMVDVAASLVIAKEAGAYISDHQGKPLKNSTNGLVASNGLLHDRVLKILK